MNFLAESKKRHPKRKRGRSLFICDSVILKIMGDGVAKLDEVKEILNTLRIWLSLTMGLIVIVTGGLISPYDHGLIDDLFYSGFFALFILLLVVFITFSIYKKSK